MKLTDTAMAVLKARYFRPGEESWRSLVKRVAGFFGTNTDETVAFQDVIENLKFLPNSPCLMNADTEITSYSACFVLPVEDNIESIYKYYTDAAIIGKSGGGVGANFSNLRAADSRVKSTEGVASGPLSFMRIQDVSTEVIKQGGKRRGANMGILDCDHPDIEKFIDAKTMPGQYENFNLSVRISDKFMGLSAVAGPNERRIFEKIVRNAHASGEPGILFGDRIENDNVLPDYKPLNATNPCGEQPLFPYESCILGSINLGLHVVLAKDKPVMYYGPAMIGIMKSTGYRIDWDTLRKTVRTAVIFLNRVVDKSIFPLPELNEAADWTRKIGLGIMGLHDMLIQLRIPYDSSEGREVAARVMEFIQDNAIEMSEELGANEGYYSAHKAYPDSPKRRNANLTTIAPTGTLSMIADCSGGCEPYYSVFSEKHVLDHKFLMPNKHLKSVLMDHMNEGLAEELLAMALEKRSLDLPGIPEEVKRLFRGADEIHYVDHVLMQAALQPFVDSSISKTINMHADATVEDVESAYALAFSHGCKGITVYRDGCRGKQIMYKQEVTPESEDDDDSDCQELPPVYKLELEDRLEAVRHRLTDNEGNKVYFTVCTQDDAPVEVFARLPYEAQDSYWNTICRLLSLCMRYRVPLDDITKQLRKGATSVVDMPAKLARILDEYKEDYSSDDDEDDDEVVIKNVSKRLCPECDTPMVFQGGCEDCPSCGFSKCS